MPHSILYTNTDTEILEAVAQEYDMSMRTLQDALEHQRGPNLDAIRSTIRQRQLDLEREPEPEHTVDDVPEPDISFDEISIMGD